MCSPSYHRATAKGEDTSEYATALQAHHNRQRFLLWTTLPLLRPTALPFCCSGGSEKVMIKPHEHHGIRSVLATSDRGTPDRFC